MIRKKRVGSGSEAVSSLIRLREDTQQVFHNLNISRRSFVSRIPHSMLTAVLISIVVVFSLEFFRRRWKLFRYFKDRGIPGPEPHFLWGHYRELRRDHLKWIDRWIGEHGKTFGVFWGDKPFLITTDTEIQKRVCIKDSSDFPDRTDQLIVEESHPLTKSIIAVAKGSDWKRIRNAVSPAFSSAKLKQMVPSIQYTSKRFLENIEDKGPNESFDVYPLLQRYTFDTYLRALYGIEADTQKYPEQTTKLMKAALASVDQLGTTNLHLICHSFSFVNSLLSSVSYFLFNLNLLKIPMSIFVEEMMEAVRMRVKSPPSPDLLQSLLESQGNPDPLKRLSLDEIVANSTNLLQAGYDTTSTCLSTVFYYLGKNPDIQRELRQEIREVLNGRDPSYDDLSALKLLDRVFKETLRIFPPASGFTTRKAAVTQTINGMEISKGLGLYFPVDQIHHDPDKWEDPMRFDPDRFLEVNENTLAHQPFGEGPRICLGMRYALLKMKILVCVVLASVEFVTHGELIHKPVHLLAQPEYVKIPVRKL